MTLVEKLARAIEDASDEVSVAFTGPRLHDTELLRIRREANTAKRFRQTRALLSTLEAEGYAIVKREPTEEMLRTKRFESEFPPDISESVKQSWRDEYAKIWASMLAASPKLTD